MAYQQLISGMHAWARQHQYVMCSVHTDTDRHTIPAYNTQCGFIFQTNTRLWLSWYTSISDRHAHVCPDQSQAPIASSNYSSTNAITQCPRHRPCIELHLNRAKCIHCRASLLTLHACYNASRNNSWLAVRPWPDVASAMATDGNTRSSSDSHWDAVWIPNVVIATGRCRLQMKTADTVSDH